MTNLNSLYLGKAGHLAMMAEFLMLGWNVAIPEVDTGDDIFVVQDRSGTLRRVQVKTATARMRKKGFSARFLVPKAQLFRSDPIEIHYVFLVRVPDGWSKPLILRQDVLRDYVDQGGVGSASTKAISLYFAYSGDPIARIDCSGVDFSQYLGDYSDFPIMR